MRFEFWNAWMHSKLSSEKKFISMNLGLMIEWEEKRFVYHIRCSSNDNNEEKNEEKTLTHFLRFGRSLLTQRRWHDLLFEEDLWIEWSSNLWDHTSSRGSVAPHLLLLPIALSLCTLLAPFSRAFFPLLMQWKTRSTTQHNTMFFLCFSLP